MEKVVQMRKRVADETQDDLRQQLYRDAQSLAEALDPANVATYNRKATGEKYLIDPTR